MDRNKGLQDRDIKSKIDEFNSTGKDIARIILIRKSLAEQMAYLIQDAQDDPKEALADLYLKVIYGETTYRKLKVFVSVLAETADGGIMIG